MRSLLRAKLVNGALGVAALALLLVVVATRERLTTGERQARQDHVLVRFDPGSLDRVEIARGSDRLVLERATGPDAADASFRITSPTVEEADPTAIQQLIGSLELATVVRRIPPEAVDRAGFGLDAPRLVIALRQGPTSYRILLGKPAPAPPGGAYLEVSGDGAPGVGVMVVRREIAEQLDVRIDALRSNQLAPYLATALRGISLEGQGGQRKLRRAPPGWRFDGMLDDSVVDRDASDRLGVALTRLRIDRFLDLPAAERAQRNVPTVTVTQLPADPNRPQAVITVGGSCPGSADLVVAMRREPSPLAGCVPSSVAGSLAVSGQDLVSRAPFAFHTDEVERLTVSRGARRLELVRSDRGFQLIAPRPAPVDLEVGNRRIEALLGVRGTPPAARATLNAPASEVVIEGSGSLTERLLVGDADAAGRVLVRRQADGALLEIDRDSARLLDPDSSVLRDLTVLRLDANSVRSVSLQWDGQRQIIRRGSGGGLDLEEPKGHGIDGGQASAILDAVTTLVAERWVADQDDGSFGLDAPTLRCTVTVDGGDAGPRDHSFVVGRGAYAQLGSEPAVFLLSRATIDVLRTWAIDRSVFALGEGEADRIEIETPRGKVALARSGDHFEQIGGEPKLSPAQIDVVLQALGDLQAEAAVHLGPARPEEGLAQPEILVRYRRRPPGRRPDSIRIGTGDSWRRMSVHYARAEGVDATYVIARSRIEALVRAW
jgi:hypothetical protein